MATLDQQRATLAFANVAGEQGVKSWSAARQKKYASIVHAMPALLRSAGLSQALHFVLSRKERDQQIFLDHLASQMTRVDPQIVNRATLLDKVRSAELSAYLRLTQEALACVVWYRRFVQGELGLDAGDVDGNH